MKPKIITLGNRKALYWGPDVNDPRPGMDLRAHVNMTMKVSKDTVKVRCPYCGGRGKARIRPGKMRRLVVWHEPWCPVPTDNVPYGR